MVEFERELKLCSSHSVEDAHDIEPVNAIFTLLMSASPNAVTSNIQIFDQIVKRVLPSLGDFEKNCILNKLHILKYNLAGQELSEYDLIKHARFATPGELEDIALKSNLPVSVTSILVSRGFSQAICVLTANKTAKLSKSSLSMIIELAFSNLQLKENLTHRIDVPEALLLRLMPYLNENQKVQLLTADFVIDSKTAVQCLANERDMNPGNGVDPSRAIDDTLSRLCIEMRIHEIADVLSERLCMPLALAMNFLNSRMDFCRALVLNAAGADVNSVLSILRLKQIKNVRLNSDAGAIHKLSQNYTLEKAFHIINLCLEKMQKIGLIGPDIIRNSDAFFASEY